MHLTKRYSDQELIENIKRNLDLDDAIRFLYREHFDGISNYVQYNKGTSQDGEDQFQELLVAFIEIVQQEKFRGDSSVKTFLYAVVKNRWMNELKRRDRALKREKKFELEQDRETEGINTYKTITENKLQIEAIMDQLGENCKKILLAVYFDDASMKEILTTMNYENEQVLRNKKYKCLKELERLLIANPSLSQTLKSALTNE